MQVIDYAWSGPTAQQIKQWGYSGVQRYISHDSSKDLSPAERDALRALDLTIGLVFESTAGEALNGFIAGHDDAAFANGVADSLGYPKDCTLWYAVDFDATAGQVQAYFTGIGSIAGRPYAPYGGFNVIEYVMYPALGWQTVAWSGGKVSKRAGLLQNHFANGYDINTVLVSDYGQWGGVKPPAPVPVPTYNGNPPLWRPRRKHGYHQSATT